MLSKKWLKNVSLKGSFDLFKCLAAVPHLKQKNSLNCGMNEWTRTSISNQELEVGPLFVLVNERMYLYFQIILKLVVGYNIWLGA